MKIESYKDLIVWQKSIELVGDVYNITRQMPKSETFCLATQMQRAVISIPSNIAEGFGRKGSKEFVQFLYISHGSTLELETQIIVSKKLYPEIDYEKAEGLLIEVQKMLRVLSKKIEGGVSSNRNK